MVLFLKMAPNRSRESFLVGSELDVNGGGDVDNEADSQCVIVGTGERERPRGHEESANKHFFLQGLQAIKEKRETNINFLFHSSFLFLASGFLLVVKRLPLLTANSDWRRKRVEKAKAAILSVRGQTRRRLRRRASRGRPRYDEAAVLLL